jgi:hypothetical protein
MTFLLSIVLLSAQASLTPDLGHRTAPQRVSKTEDRYFTIAFDPTADAQSQLEFKLNGAKIMKRKLLVIMGGNWCHDSAALANLIDTPRFVGMMTQYYEILFVDVGIPQTGRGRNLDMAKRFGIKKVKGTPLVMVLSPDGKLLNSRRDAASWRNAASRSEDDIFRYFAEFQPSTT